VLEGFPTTPDIDLALHRVPGATTFFTAPALDTSGLLPTFFASGSRRSVAAPASRRAVSLPFRFVLATAISPALDPCPPANFIT
jgi:hypothetical protein